MTKRLCLSAAFTLSLILAAATPWAEPVAHAFPEPAIVSSSWELDFEYDQPRPVAVEALDGSTQWYWYLPYKVTNRTGDDRLFLPEFTIYTDQGDLINSGENVPSHVFAVVKRQLRNDLLESPVEVVGQLLQGEDYARESVAIWPAFTHDIDEMNIFVGGMSGETQTIQNPLTGDRVLVRRNVMLQYRMPGNHPTPRDQPVIFAGERDVMR